MQTIQPDPAAPVPTQVFGGSRSRWAAVKLGWRACCPNCGARSLFSSYVKMASRCDRCSQDFEPFRADDAPAYFTILVVGHIIVPLMLMLEQVWTPSLWLLVAIWPPLTLALCLLLLPRIKGAVIAFQWAINLHAGKIDSI
jgi:uncharacterized protein (DUF983 family)